VRLVQSAAPVLAVLALLAACADEPGGTPPAPPAPPAAGQLAAPPSIVLVTLDTLRKEHLGCYGYFRPTTPNLDALAAEALVFERAFAPMASTLPSHLTMLTGLYPHQHGMTSNRRGAGTPFTSELGRLSAAEVLAAAGYRTAAFVSAAPLSPRTGVQAGFQHFSAREEAPGASQRAADTTRLVLDWLAREENRAANSPMFLWVHYFDPHEPNDPPPRFARSFSTDEPLRAWIRARGIDPAALGARYAHSERVRRHFLRNDLSAGREDASVALEVTLDSLADLVNRYDAELAYLDEELGRLFEGLRTQGAWEEAIVIVVADHGQSLGENTWLGHGTITDVNTTVPLLLRLPRALGLAPRRISTPVSLVDLMPTVLARFELAGSELLRGQFEGEDLLSGAFARPHVLLERTADELADGETGRQYALHTGRWKYIHRPEGQDELYDLAGAGEFNDVLAAHPTEAAALRAELAKLLARRPALLAHEREGEADAAQLEALEGLGYGGEDD
jgi:arylsulfatase